MATTALIAAKPFETFAKISTPITGFNIDKNALLLVHSNNFAVQNVTGSIKVLKDKHANVAVFNTGNTPSEKIKADATVCINDNIIPTANNYKIFNKGNIKIGVLSADGADNSINQVNSVATYLKKEKNCDMVVCLSLLGFRNKTGIDDITLAQTSANVDVILGGHKDNSSAAPYIVLNKEQQEVIIDHRTDTNNALGQIAIKFNDKKQKVNIAF